MRIFSWERTTGKGACHCTQIYRDGEWIPVSEVPSAVHVRREDGFEIFRVEVSSSVSFRAYHRSNSGAEKIACGEMCISPHQWAPKAEREALVDGEVILG